MKLWNVKTGECLKTLQGHTSSVLAITFSPNGQLLASGGYEQTIKLWQDKYRRVSPNFAQTYQSRLPLPALRAAEI